MQADLSARTGARLVSADRVSGTAVYNRDGERLGTIDKVFIDKTSGQAEFATMAFGGVLGIGEKHHPLPWQVLTYDPSLEGFVVDLDKTILQQSPSYDDERLAAADFGWEREVRGHFGLA
jgi:hypothetical protein